MSERKPKDNECWFVKIDGFKNIVPASFYERVYDGRTHWVHVGYDYASTQVTPLAPVPDYALWQETVAALVEISKQRLTDEIPKDELYDCDFESACDEIVKIARATRAKIKALGGE